MPKQPHDHKAHVMTSAAADIHHGTCSSRAQSAAAWAWLQRGGGTCITPRKAEGLMAANLNVKYKWSSPSRFKMELMRRAEMEDIAARRAEDSGAACTKGHARRRHSFHVEDLAGIGATVGSFSSRSSSTTAVSATWSAQIVADHDDQDVMKGYNLHAAHVDEASSLLDKFELEAVWRQLHQISTPSSMSTTEGPAGATPQKVMSSPQELKPHRRLHRSIDDLSAHKSRRKLSTRFHHHHHHHRAGDDQHAGHHQYGHLLHQLLGFRSGRSPAYCSSIATVNSIVDHHQSVSPKKFRAHAVNPEKLGAPHGIELPLLEHTADEGIAAYQLQEKERSASSRHHKLQAPLPQLLAAPATRHHTYSKLFQSLIHRLPHSSQISHESTSSRGHFHDHRHFHHHHHYHHHHVRRLHDDQQHAAADAAPLLHLDDPLMGKDFVSAVQRPKLYSLHKLGSTHAAEFPRRGEKEGGLHPADIRRKSRAAASKDEY